MSVLLTTEDGWIISHLNYLNEIYENVRDAKKYCSLKFNATFFDINCQFLRDNQLSKASREIVNSKSRRSRKRKRSNELSQQDLLQIDYVKEALLRMQCRAVAGKLFETSNCLDNNDQAREVSKKFYTESSLRPLDNFHGINRTKNPIVAQAANERYVFPKKCSFYAYDVRRISEKLDSEKLYDFVLMDPPWWNKFVRRKKERFSESSYRMMNNEEFAKIPIQDLLKSDGIVAVWCTNAQSHLRSITNEMFPAWGVEYMAKWYWVKVTQSGNPICDFNSTAGKQPYEILIFGSKSSKKTPHFPDKKLIVSVPSGVHSHKPPLAEVIKPFLDENPECLEIFARYLVPEWTSWGLEVLKFQHLSLYDIAQQECDEDLFENDDYQRGIRADSSIQKNECLLKK